MTSHLAARVIASRAAGALRVVTLAPVVRRLGWLEDARPGQFVMVNVGAGDAVARRPYWIHRVAPAGGYAAALDLLVSPVGPASTALATAPPGSEFDLTGPLGRGFRLPRGEVAATLVAAEHSVAALAGVADGLRQRHCRVRLVLVARDDAHRFGTLEGRRLAHELVLAGPDDALDLGDADVVYAAGPPGLLERVVRMAEKCGGAATQCALETPMACGTGLCHGCPVGITTDHASATHVVRACADGPVLPGDRVDWPVLRASCG